MEYNEYDKEAFFNQYKQMSRSTDGLKGAGEWHELQKLLPDFRVRMCWIWAAVSAGTASTRWTGEPGWPWESTYPPICWRRQKSAIFPTASNTGSAAFWNMNIPGMPSTW